MGNVLRVFQLAQCKVCCDDERALIAVSAVYDVVNLLQRVICFPLNAEVVNDEKRIAAQAIYNIVPVVPAPVQVVQQSG